LAGRGVDFHVRRLLQDFEHESCALCFFGRAQELLKIVKEQEHVFSAQKIQELPFGFFRTRK